MRLWQIPRPRMRGYNMANSHDSLLASIVPSDRQVSFQQTEFYAFIHYTVNTYTNQEWGDGTEDPAIFNPTEFDAHDWVAAVKSAGMRGLILTCKHHDGFCLWPSKHTVHTIAASPYKNGKGDIVKEVADACREGGIKFGVYLSPWDRNQPCYGTGKEYDDYFVAQLTELLTNYGEIFTVWFDGACGEGPNGKKQYYDWQRYFDTVRKLQPNACMNVCGPDIRWCGNEAGDTRPEEWSVVPRRTQDTERIASQSQQSDNEEFRLRTITASDRDLGSRAVLADERDLVWYPAEVNTSIRPGWFYHAEEDGKVKTADELFSLYLRTVGGNSTFLLNIPPMPSGQLHPTDIAVLQELGEKLRAAFGVNLAESAEFTATVSQPGHEIDNAKADGYDRWFETPQGVTECEVTLTWQQPQRLSYLVLKENILRSQRMEKFSVYDAVGKRLAGSTAVGYEKILPLPADTVTDTLRIHIEDARCTATLAFVGVY